uniref:Uncharacterized protein n=1 Tax=Caenorhabditis japonica TaxID=281687 RepID=A0A8R1ENT9_CAEJA
MGCCHSKKAPPRNVEPQRPSARSSRSSARHPVPPTPAPPPRPPPPQAQAPPPPKETQIKNASSNSKESIATTRPSSETDCSPPRKPVGVEAPPTRISPRPVYYQQAVVVEPIVLVPPPPPPPPIVMAPYPYYYDACIYDPYYSGYYGGYGYDGYDFAIAL